MSREISRTQATSTAFVATAALVAVSAGVAACERTSYWGSSGEAPSTPPPASGPSATSGGGPGGGGPSVASRAMLLEAVASCAVELYGGFEDAAAELAARSSDADQQPDAMDAARSAWGSAIDLWQQAELFQFGPAGPATTPGGQALREYVYSWPLVNRCLVEQTLVGKSYEDPSFASYALINVRGLGAGEYLLFYTGTDNACSATASINSSGSWAALGASELDARKRAYARVLGADIAARGKQLFEAWSPEHGNFSAKLTKPGSDDSPYASEQQALNAVSDALMYLDHMVKDRKVGHPLGLIDCEATTCKEDVESLFAHRSKQHVYNNLLGFQRIFSGCDAGEGVGFDDLLSSENAGDLGAQMRADVEAAVAAAVAIEEDDLGDAITADRKSVEALHAAIKRVTDALKTQFLSVLVLEPPKIIEGDND
jgi:predicted lipoprotein